MNLSRLAQAAALIFLGAALGVWFVTQTAPPPTTLVHCESGTERNPDPQDIYTVVIYDDCHLGVGIDGSTLTVHVID